MDDITGTVQLKARHSLDKAWGENDKRSFSDKSHQLLTKSQELKYTLVDCREGSEIMSIYCSYRGPGFNS